MINDNINMVSTIRNKMINDNINMISTIGIK